MYAMVTIVNNNVYLKWHPTPVLLPGKSHGWKSLVGYSLWGRKELDTTEQLHTLYTQCSHLSFPPYLSKGSYANTNKNFY